jgi:hypothetical protein
MANGRTPIVQAGHDGRYLGELTATIDRDVLTVDAFQTHPIDDTIPGDAVISQIIERFKKRVTELVFAPRGFAIDQPLVRIEKDLTNASSDLAASTILANLCTDAFRKATTARIALDSGDPVTRAIRGEGKGCRLLTPSLDHMMMLGMRQVRTEFVTSLTRAEYKPRYLYEKIYCARGDMENRIKECQLDLYADRTSAATMRANQLRLWLASMAYVLLCAMRHIALGQTKLDNASCGSIRLKLLKIGALVSISVRRIKIAMASACPAADIWGLAAVRLAAAANARASPV